MKITMINSQLLPVPPVLGGPVEQTLFETALTIRRPQMTVVSPFVTALKKNGIATPPNIFYHVNVQAQKKQLKNTLSASSFYTQDPEGFYYLSGVSDHIDHLAPDIIQVHNRADYTPFLLQRFPKKRHILYMHNEPDYSEPALKKSVTKLDHLIFVSHFLADTFASHFPDSKSKTTVIHNSIDAQHWHPKLKQHPQTKKIKKKYGLQDGKTILFVGRTVKAKGIHCLLSVMNILQHFLPGIKLVVVGSHFFGTKATSPFLDELKKQAVQFGNRVIFTDYIDRNQIPYYYAAADVTVTPSVWDEPFGKVVIESMATGVPVIGTRRGAIPEIIDNGQNGVLIDDPEDLESLANEIIQLLTNQTARKKMGIEARKKVISHFQTSVRIKRLRSFYKYFEMSNPK